jgi:hypothetical protein
MTVVWSGPITDCDLCGGKFFTSGPMYDASVNGRWGNLCHTCFTLEGCSVGPGRGQKYEFKDNRWTKVEG